jgi:hypothetical protein
MYGRSIEFVSRLPPAERTTYLDRLDKLRANQIADGFNRTRHRRTAAGPRSVTSRCAAPLRRDFCGLMILRRPLLSYIPTARPIFDAWSIESREARWSRAVMALPQNSSALNRAALEWLKEAPADAPNHYLHLLNLAHWGLQLQIAARWGDKAGAAKPGGRPVRLERGERAGLAGDQSERAEQAGTAGQLANATGDGGRSAKRGEPRAADNLGTPGEPEHGAAAGNERLELERAGAEPGSQAGGEISTSLYDNYRPQRINVPGATPHPPICRIGRYGLGVGKGREVVGITLNIHPTTDAGVSVQK